MYACKRSLDVARKRAMIHDGRPELKRWIGHQRLRQLDDAQIIVQVGAMATPICTAGHTDARSALTPLASSTDVLTTRIQKEDVGAAASALSSPLESPARCGKSLQVKVIGDSEQQVDIFRVWLVCHQGADQRNSEDAGKLARDSYEAESLQKEELAQRRESVLAGVHDRLTDCDAERSRFYAPT